MSDNEKRLWFDFKNPTHTSLLLGSAARGARDLLEAGKVEEAKQMLNAVIAEMDKERMPNEDEMTAMFFGEKKE